MPELQIAPELTLPLEVVTESIAILAVKRAGKSNAAVVMAEQMYDAQVPWVAIDPKGDWWGVRSNQAGDGPGLEVIVFGGEHADVPLEPTAGNLVADLIVDERLTCVLDVSEMTKADQRRFLTDFASRLYKRNREPLHVFCEEADEYIPQRVMADNTRLVGAFETLVKRGGFRGIGITLITQRSASLNKDVLTQVGTLIALRTPSPQDRKAVEAWIDHHAASRDIIAELPSLVAGQAWVSRPLGDPPLVKVQFRQRRTFDSGATPKVGEIRRVPTRLADVDLAAIKEQMADTLERAKAEDPKELRKRIAILERDLAAVQAARTAAERAAPEPVVERVQVPVLEDQVRGQLLDALSLTGSTIAEAADVMEALGPRLSDLRDTLRAWSPELPAGAKEGSPRDRVAPGLSRQQHERVVRSAGTPNTGEGPRRQQASPAASADAGPSDHKVTGPQQRILDSLAWYASVGLAPAKRSQLAFFADASPKSSAFGNNLGSLRTAGLIDYPGTGLVDLTAAGRAIAVVESPVTTSEQLQDQVIAKLPGPQRLIVRALVDVYPDAIGRADLADVVGASASSSAYGNNLGALRSLGVIDYPATGQVAATSLLFLDGGR